VVKQKVEARKRKERLLPDEEVLNPDELKEKKRRVRMAMYMQDKRLKEEEEKMWSQGICGCGMILTTNGECPTGRH